jgi:Leucine-rich repeat (LRR) protein
METQHKFKGNLDHLPTICFENDCVQTLNLTTLNTGNGSGNKLSTLPRTVGNLSMLLDLLCTDNELTSLPPSLKDLESLQVLYCQIPIC